MTVEDGVPLLLEDFDGLEYVYAAETAEAEALEPRSLAEAKRMPEWPLWEKAIDEEMATLKAHRHHLRYPQHHNIQLRHHPLAQA
jgi:hypothetical protein